MKKSAVSQNFAIKPLTANSLYGLMRLVARIAQSVEQGIENPRVLGSIPSPGTTHQKRWSELRAPDGRNESSH